MFTHYVITDVATDKITPEKPVTNDHFLIRYPQKDYIEPHGLSGCGVWTRFAYGDGRPIWTPNIQLLGIQSSFFRKSKTLKAIGVKSIVDILSNHGVLT